jgi:transposase
MLASGQSLEAAGLAVGISKSSAHRWIERYGMDAVGGRRVKPRLTAEQRDRIHNMRRRGNSVSKTARTAGTSRDTVRRIAAMERPSFRCPTCGGRVLEARCLACALVAA